MDKHLYYRRQFLLANNEINELSFWQHIKVSGKNLYAHPDLEITTKELNSIQIVLLGYIFDPFHPDKKNADILSEIIFKINKFTDLIAHLKPYPGRYAIIYKDEENFNILHDALGLREIYFCIQPNKIICGSQPNLIDKYSLPKLGITNDQNILNFYAHDMKSIRSGRMWIGDETYFTNIKKLISNHYLDINSLTAKRYWPNKRLESMNFDQAVKLSCAYLQGTLKAVTSRFDVMMAVTSGIDSRSLLASSKEVKEKIYYYINKHPHLNDKSPDIRIPRDIFKKLNIPFHIHEYSATVDDEFKKIFLDNTFMSSELNLPAIYNVYYKNHANKINLLGVGEIGREFYGKAPVDLDGYYLARSLKYKYSKYATEQCEKWLTEAKKVSEVYNVDIMKMLLWEVLLGNWGVVGNSESDIAIEEFDPYNSHYIYEIMLSLDPVKENLFEGMFTGMWPELLGFPFNPAETISDWIKHWLGRFGFANGFKRTLYRLDRWKFRKMMEAKKVQIVR